MQTSGHVLHRRQHPVATVAAPACISAASIFPNWRQCQAGCTATITSSREYPRSVCAQRQHCHKHCITVQASNDLATRSELSYVLRAQAASDLVPGQTTCHAIANTTAIALLLQCPALALPVQAVSCTSSPPTQQSTHAIAHASECPLALPAANFANGTAQALSSADCNSNHTPQLLPTPASLPARRPAYATQGSPLRSAPPRSWASHRSVWSSTARYHAGS
jgi:hypothetical protein